MDDNYIKNIVREAYQEFLDEDLKDWEETFVNLDKFIDDLNTKFFPEIEKISDFKFKKPLEYIKYGNGLGYFYLNNKKQGNSIFKLKKITFNDYPELKFDFALYMSAGKWLSFKSTPYPSGLILRQDNDFYEHIKEINLNQELMNILMKMQLESAEVFDASCKELELIIQKKIAKLSPQPDITEIHVGNTYDQLPNVFIEMDYKVDPTRFSSNKVNTFACSEYTDSASSITLTTSIYGPCYQLSSKLGSLNEIMNSIIAYVHTTGDETRKRNTLGKQSFEQLKQLLAEVTDDFAKNSDTVDLDDLDE